MGIYSNVVIVYTHECISYGIAVYFRPDLSEIGVFINLPNPVCIVRFTIWEIRNSDFFKTSDELDELRIR